MPPDLNSVAVFVRVVQTGSFTAAARFLGMPKSTVSLRVSELEERLGARLLQRTTRRLSLTDEGRIYYDHCVRIMSDFEDAERAITSLQESPRGHLRITVPASTQFLSSVLTDFLERWDGVRLDVLCTDRRVNLVEEQFDLGIRAGALSDSTLIAKNLGAIDFVLVASPRYVARHGRPRSPADLAEHRCLMFSVGDRPRNWRLLQGNQVHELALTPVLSANDLDILHDAVVRGVGIAILPTYRCTEDLRSKRLEHLLPRWDAPSEPFHALYPSGRHLSPKVKSLLDHLQQMMSAPWTKRSTRPARRDGAPVPGSPPRPRGT